MLGPRGWIEGYGVYAGRGAGERGVYTGGKDMTVEVETE